LARSTWPLIHPPSGLIDQCAVNEPGFLILIERFGSKEIKIQRFAMPEVKRDGCSTIKNKVQLSGRHKAGPDFRLRRRQDG